MSVIAYIEDSVTDAMIFEKYFKNEDVKIYTTHADYLASRVSHDIIVCDFQVPDRTDQSMSDIIEKEDCPFVLFTGGALIALGENNIKYLKNTGIDALFEKSHADDMIDFVNEQLKGAVNGV